MNQNKTEDEEYFKKGKRQSSLIDPLQVLQAYFESSPNFFYVAHRTGREFHLGPSLLRYIFLRVGHVLQWDTKIFFH